MSLANKPQNVLPSNILLVSDSDLEAIKHWPLELRALFDPRAVHELVERARQSVQERTTPAADDEIPF